MARQRFLSAVFKDKEDMTAALGSTVSRQQDVRLSSASDNFIIPTMMTETQLPFVEAGSFFIFRCFQMSLKGGPMKKFLKTFLRGLIFCLSRDLPLEGRKPFTRTLTIEYTFIRYVPERGRKSQPNEGAPRPICPSGL